MVSSGIKITYILNLIYEINQTFKNPFFRLNQYKQQNDFLLGISDFQINHIFWQIIIQICSQHMCV